MSGLIEQRVLNPRQFDFDGRHCHRQYQWMNSISRGSDFRGCGIVAGTALEAALKNSLNS